MHMRGLPEDKRSTIYIRSAKERLTLKCYCESPSLLIKLKRFSEQVKTVGETYNTSKTIRTDRVKLDEIENSGCPAFLQVPIFPSPSCTICTILETYTVSKINELKTVKCVRIHNNNQIFIKQYMLVSLLRN